MIKQYQLNKLQNNFEITLNYKGVKVKVSFTGGNTYKGIPPTCYEKDLFRQRAIEASQMFKDKEIALKRTIADASDHKAAVAVQTKKVVAPKNVVRKVTKLTPKPEPTPTPEPARENTVQEPEPTKTDDGSKEFANLGEAILYVAQNYNEQAKTEKEVRDILKAHGINPKIKRG